MPVEWATTMMNLANAYCNRIRGERAENIEQAIGHYRAALEVMTREAMPDDHRRVQRSLARLHVERHGWEEAVTSARAALEVTDLLYRAAPTPEARQAQLAETQSMPALLAFALARIAENDPSRLKEAVLVLERHRARWLAEALALRTEQPPTVPQAVWNVFDGRRSRVRELVTEAQLPDGTPGKRDFLILSELLRAARDELDAAIEQVRRYAPDFMPEPTFAAVQQAAQDAPLAYLLATSAGGLALVVLPEGGGADGVLPVWLPDLTGEQVRHHVEGPSSRHYGGYLGAYWRWQRSLHGETSPKERQNALDDWLQTLNTTTRWLWDVAMGPLIARLHAAGAREAVLVPTGLLGLLPLHAAWTPDDNAATGRRYALDELPLRYTPSALALLAAREMAARAPADRLLQVVEPQPTSASPLPAAREEARAVRAAWPGGYTSRWHAAATWTEVRARLLEHTVFHFNGHAFAGWQEPLAGGLLLAHDRVLSVADWQDLAVQMRLAVLSACETGVPGLELPDEVIGLPAALLQAGCAGVVTSLWSVLAVSTARLMAHFYQAWQREGLSPPQALRRAQMRLRDEDGYAHPFFWAAFTYTGV
ncbi:MAG: hypothetical protein KatS3mg050_3571 [Litorilinea sp.]|nr:MAG: hypothetical protein KatS3mg050_3571 [Litorilinea sp.]